MFEGYLVLATLIRWAIASCPGPVALPVTEVTLSNNNVMRGIPFTVGTPAQNISFMPHDYLNDTWVYNSTSGFCPSNTSQNFCITYRGGLYDDGASSTAKPAVSVYATGGDPSDAQRTLGTHMWDAGWINDVLSFGNLSFPSFPIGMPDNSFGGDFDTQNNIGMGINSTLLTALQSAGKIAGRSWSWWWGLTGATEDVQMDGSIIFGGYDQAKTVGEGWTQKLQLPTVFCPSGMHVTISDLVLNFPNGTQTSITAPDVMTACLQPDFTVVMTILQTPYFTNFEIATNTKSLGRGGGNGLDARGMLYSPGEVFAGSLTVQLDNGAFSVEIPNDILAVPPQQVEADGAISTDTSTVEILLDPTAGVNDQDATILGRQFFSSVYVSVDYDAGTFTLWKANPTQDTDLVALGAGCSAPKPKATSTQTSTHPSRTGTGTATPTGSRNSKPEAASPLSTAAIVGIAVGGALGALIAAGCIAFYCMRKRKKQQHPMVQKDDIGPPERRGTPYFLDSGGNKMHEAFSSEVQEMQAYQNPSEMAAETRPLELTNDKAARSRQVRLLGGLNSPVELA